MSNVAEVLDLLDETAVILDANVLLYAVDADSPHRQAAGDWLTRR